MAERFPCLAEWITEPDITLVQYHLRQILGEVILLHQQMTCEQSDPQALWTNFHRLRDNLQGACAQVFPDEAWRETITQAAEGVAVFREPCTCTSCTSWSKAEQQEEAPPA